MSKKQQQKMYFYADSCMADVESAIHLLCEAYDHCTPSQVLLFAQAKSSPHMLRLVVELAEALGYPVEQSGRGYVIKDW